MIPEITKASIILDMPKDSPALLVYMDDDGWHICGNVHPTMRKQFLIDYLNSQGMNIWSAMYGFTQS